VRFEESFSLWSEGRITQEEAGKLQSAGRITDSKTSSKSIKIRAVGSSSVSAADYCFVCGALLILFSRDSGQER